MVRAVCVCIALSIYAVSALTPGSFVRINGAPGTGCGNGSPFAFFVRLGDPERILLDFEGGGACGDFASCFSPGSFGSRNSNLGGIEDSIVGSSSGFAGTPAFVRGPFPTGPFPFGENSIKFNNRLDSSNYTAIYIPYCTQDFGLGTNKNAIYVNPANSSDVRRYQHNGLANTLNVLQFMFTTFPSVKAVFTGGSSAGAFTALWSSIQIEKNYGTGPSRPKYLLFLDSFFGIGTPLSSLVSAQWGADCALQEMNSLDLTDPQEFNQPLTQENCVINTARKSSGFVIIYSALVDPFQQISIVNPQLAPGVNLYPSDIFQNKFRTLMGRLTALNNVRVYSVNEYTSFQTFIASGVPPPLLGFPHTATGSGDFFLTFLDPDLLSFYTTTFGPAFPFPYWGFRPDVRPANFMSSTNWVNQALRATTAVDLPPNIVCTVCSSETGPGCNGASGPNFVPYNACGGCGGSNGCALTASGAVSNVDIINGLVVQGKSLSQILAESIQITSQGVRAPVFNFVTEFRFAVPQCPNLTPQRECLSIRSDIPNQFCDRNCNNNPSFCPSTVCECALGLRPLAPSTPQFRGINGVPDSFCNTNCNHVPPFCPSNFCVPV